MGLIDIFLMTSAYEGLPLALLEAMALGKPVVATAVGGIPEVVCHGEEGLLAAVGAVEELTRLVLQLLENPALRSRLGRRGAKKVEDNFHVKDRISVVERLYSEILAKSCNGLQA
jgi:glycosyltransferase involved in cell wall biosynthesis